MAKLSHTAIFGDLVVTGDLSIKGTQFINSSSETAYTAAILGLNTDFVAGSPTENCGLEITRGDDPKTSLLWIEANNQWEAGDALGVTTRIWTAGNMGHTSGLNADLLDDEEGTWYAALSRNETITGTWTFNPTTAIYIEQDKYLEFNGNTTWGGKLRIGGNGNTVASALLTSNIASTNGNLHLDSVISGTVYLNWYNTTGTSTDSCVIIGNGDGGTVNTRLWDIKYNGQITSTNEYTANNTHSGNNTFSGLNSFNGGTKLGIQNKVNGGNGQGIFMWDTDDANWGMYLADVGTNNDLAGTANAVGSLSGSVGYQFRFRAVNTVDRGFTWENSSNVALMSLTADTGDLYVLNDVRLQSGNAFVVDNTNSRGIKAVTGGFGSIQTTGTGVGGYKGYNIDGNAVFMSSGTAMGLYDDTNNRWLLSYTFATGALELRHLNNTKLTTTATGIDVTGTAVVDGLTNSGNLSVTGTSTFTGNMTHNGTGTVSIGGGNVVFNKGDGDVSIGSDIYMSHGGLIAAQNSLQFNIDSDNLETISTFIWGTNSETNTATSLMTLDENADLTLYRNFVPDTNNTGSIGLTGTRWNEIFSNIEDVNTLTVNTTANLNGIVNIGYVSTDQHVLNGDLNTTNGNLYDYYAIAAGGDGYLYIAKPTGGEYAYGAASLIGQIQIKLPQSWTQTMMRFAIDVYEYDTGNAITFYVGGYNNSNGTVWNNISATQVGGNEEFPVEFSYSDDGKCAVCIGTTASVWQYPKVTVRDFTAGHTSHLISEWGDGWAIVISNIAYVYDASATTVTNRVLDTSYSNVMKAGVKTTYNTSDTDFLIVGQTKSDAGKVDNTAYGAIGLSGTNLHLDCQSGGNTYINHYDGSGIYFGTGNSNYGAVWNSSSQFIPKTHNTGSLGVNSTRWNALYATSGTTTTLKVENVLTVGDGGGTNAMVGDGLVFEKIGTTSENNLPTIQYGNIISAGTSNDLVISTTSNTGGVVFETTTGDYTNYIDTNGVLNFAGITTSGAAAFNGNVDIGDAVTDTLTITSRIDSTLARSTTRAGYLVGSYEIANSATHVNPIFAIGTTYLPDTDTTIGNMFGIGFTSSDATFINSTDLGSTPDVSSWGLYVAADGNARVFLDGEVGDGHFLGVLNSQSAAIRGSATVGGTLSVTSTISEGGTSLVSKYLGISDNAVSASKWETARTLTLTGDVAGSVSFDGSGAINMTNTVVADNSHSHTASNVSDFTTAVESILDSIQIISGSWTFTVPLISSVVTGTAPFTVASTTVVANLHSATTEALHTARSIALDGVVTGIVDFDGSGNVSITTSHTSDPIITLTGDVTGNGTMTNLGSVSFATTVANDSHTHDTQYPGLVDNETISGAWTFTAATPISFNETVDALLFKPTEATVPTSRRFLGFSYTNNDSFPYLTNRTPNGAVVIMSGGAAGGVENEHFRVGGGDGTVTTTFTNTNITTNGTIASTIATGTAPFTIASTTLVTNLNADRLDSQEGTYYLSWTNFADTPTTLAGYSISDAASKFGSSLNDFSINVLTLTNNEVTACTAGGHLVYDANDEATPTYIPAGDTQPAGLYLYDGGALTVRRIYHDGHFTGTEVGQWRTAYGWGDHSTFSYLVAADVTYENLSANGDIGTGATQVSQGDHTHDGRYYTETESDAKYLLNTTDTFIGTLSVTGGIAATTDIGVGGNVTFGNGAVDKSIQFDGHSGTGATSTYLDFAVVDGSMSIYNLTEGTTARSFNLDLGLSGNTVSRTTSLDFNSGNGVAAYSASIQLKTDGTFDVNTDVAFSDSTSYGASFEIVHSVGTNSLDFNYIGA